MQIIGKPGDLILCHYMLAHTVTPHTLQILAHFRRSSCNDLRCCLSGQVTPNSSPHVRYTIYFRVEAPSFRSAQHDKKEQNKVRPIALGCSLLDSCTRVPESVVWHAGVGFQGGAGGCHGQTQLFLRCARTPDDHCLLSCSPRAFVGVCSCDGRQARAGIDA